MVKSLRTGSSQLEREHTIHVARRRGKKEERVWILKDSAVWGWAEELRRTIMKWVRGGGRKKIEGSLQRRRRVDEDNVIAATGGFEIVRAEKEAGEFNDDGEEEGEDDNEEEEEEEKGREEDEEERPKLNEGFYEIEDVRGKKVRKVTTNATL